MLYKDTFNATRNKRTVAVTIEREISESFVEQVARRALRIMYQSVIRTQIDKGELTDEGIQEVVTAYNPEIGAVRVTTSMTQEERAENLARKRLLDNKGLKLEDLSRSKREFWLEYCLDEVKANDAKKAQKAAKKTEEKAENKSTFSELSEEIINPT